MLRQDQIQECQSKFKLSYHVNYAKICQDLVGFENLDVLEVGGSLPPEFVFNYLGAKSWTAIEAPSYAESLEQAGGISHQGTIIPSIKNAKELKFKNRQTDKYSLYLENIEDLPEEYFEQFDVIFSIATFEHIHKLPAALDKMFRSLRPGGKLFSMFSPIWSAHDGHHLPEISDRSGQQFNFGNSPIPPWGHLLMTRGEMAEYLHEKTDKETADKIVYFVYQSDHINRYFTEDYQDVIRNSPFQILRFDLTFQTFISPEIEKQLQHIYPRQKHFSNNGISLILEKSLALSQQNIGNTIVKAVHTRQDQDSSSWILTTPVTLIIFNRPETTVKVFEAIRQAKPSKLLVIADGPRNDRPDDIENCQAARAIVEQVDWDCEVLRNYSEVNLGCRKRVVSGLDWVFEQVEEAIILEDDCLPHPTFFRYCQELLEKYRNEPRIMMISGDNFQFGRNQTEYSYYFSRYGHIWGWATWKRSWILHDDSMASWPKLRDTQWLTNILNNEKAVSFWSRNFQGVYDGFNTWDYPWLFTLWSHHGLTILPNVNLISNIGFGYAGTHTQTSESPLSNMSVFPL
jgi:SAM-dependent methyltransferase